VRLTHDLPTEWVRQDLVGTVTDIFRDPNEMYEVQFYNEDGTPYDEIAVSPEEVELVESPLSGPVPERHGDYWPAPE
jgi:hypothetical protein